MNYYSKLNIKKLQITNLKQFQNYNDQITKAQLFWIFGHLVVLICL